MKINRADVFQQYKVTIDITNGTLSATAEGARKNRKYVSFSVLSWIKFGLVIKATG